MTRQEIFAQIKAKQSFLCVGLDSDIKRIPMHLLREKDPIFAFNKQIIDATASYAVAYKPNIAFYEAMGPQGWESLQKTLEYIPSECFTIADAKRGDIGNTASLYARAFFDKSASGMSFDSITVAPYMGEDSVRPFLEFEGKWAILLALTSNSGSSDFQQLSFNSEKLYQHVLKTSSKWASADRLMYVVGATKADLLLEIRKIVPEHFLLIPGVGAQGGSLEDVAKNGMNRQCGLLVNSSRGIIYAADTKDFAKTAAKEAEILQIAMKHLLEKYL